jgi:hypothetical protein
METTNWGTICTPLVVETEDGIELSTICRQLKIKVAVKRDEPYGNDENSGIQRPRGQKDHS